MARSTQSASSDRPSPLASIPAALLARRLVFSVSIWLYGKRDGDVAAESKALPSRSSSLARCRLRRSAHPVLATAPAGADAGDEGTQGVDVGGKATAEQLAVPAAHLGVCLHRRDTRSPVHPAWLIAVCRWLTARASALLLFHRAGAVDDEDGVTWDPALP